MTKQETRGLLVALGVLEEECTQTEWNVRGADLSGADLSEADLSRTDLSGADLSGADLRQADLSGANLGGANLCEAYLSGANLAGANLHGADLTSAYLAGASLVEADLAGANLHGADLTDATLTSALLVKTDLTGANLNGACIDNATISGWIIEDVNCSYITEVKSGKQVKIGFGPQEFEKKYTRMRIAAEVVAYPSGGRSMDDVQRLIEKYEKRIAELEAQIGALRHKHDILVEASRLLEEEAQAPDASNQ